MRRDFRGGTEGHEAEIVSGDLADIDSCDAVLAAFTARRRGHLHGGVVRAPQRQVRRRLHRRACRRTRGPSTSPTPCTPTSPRPSPPSRAHRMRKAVVVGAGAMGAAAARALAERGWAVSLIEQHAIGHDLGASGHATRSFRLSHTEADDVRLAVRALELWNDLERRGGETLLQRNGLLQRGSVVPPMAEALREAGVRYDELDHRDVSRAVPRDAPAARRRRRSSSPTAPSSSRAARSSCRCGSRAPRAPSCTRARSASRVDAAGRRRARLHAPPPARRRRRRRLRGPVVAAAARPARAQPAAHRGPRPGHLVPQPARGLGGAAGADGAHARRRRLRDARARPRLQARLGDDQPDDVLEGVEGAARTTARTSSRSSSACARTSRASTRRRCATRPGRSRSCPTSTFVIDRQGPVVVGAACIGHAFKFSPVLGELFADLAEERPLPPEARRFGLDRPTLAPERRSGRVADRRLIARRRARPARSTVGLHRTRRAHGTRGRRASRQGEPLAPGRRRTVGRVTWGRSSPAPSSSRRSSDSRSPRKGAGIASPFAILIAAIGMLALAWIISRYAKRIHAAGALYDYVSEGFGRRVRPLRRLGLLRRRDSC